MKAFPTAIRVDKESYDSGMDLRDYFAAKAMQAIMQTPSARDLGGERLIAKTAYEYADAMMKARKND